jgi:signal transduction histidine kinase
VASIAEVLEDVRVTYRPEGDPQSTAPNVFTVPVPGQHGPVGTLRLELGPKRRLSADETNYLVATAGTLANALERRQIEDDLRRSEDRLRVVNEELGRSNAELSRFAAIAAHDLKAPLNTVSQFSNLIRESTPPSPETEPYFDTIARATDRMRNLVDRLLTYSRVGAIDAKPTAVDTATVLDGVRADLDAAITASGAEITHDPMPTVSGDPVGLRQLFQNLISNALKFVAPGQRPRVHVGVRADGDRWRFTVHDDGIGVEPKEAAEIFEPFRRLRAGAYEGTGLGLAICLRIVERHGGEIWMESRPGRGSDFVFTLPRLNT